MLQLLQARRVRAALLLALVLLADIISYAAAADTAESRVLPMLQRAAAARPDRQFRVIVTRLEHGSNAARRALALGGKKIKDLKHDAFVAHLPGRVIAALGRHR